MAPSDDDLARLKASFDANGSPKELAHLRWQYLDCPVKKVLVDFAEPEEADDARLAAVYATFPVTFDVGSERIVGSQSLDTLTDEAFRGQGLFKRMARSVYERSRADGVGLVYGFPNGASAHGFFNRLEWRPLDPVPFLIRPLRLAYAARKVRPWLVAPDLPLPLVPHRRLPSGHEIRDVHDLDDSVDALWDAFRGADTVAVRRDTAYLRWRLLEKPSVTYRCRGYYVDGALRGFAASTVADKHGGRVGYIMELLARPEEPHVARRLLGDLLRGLARERADVAMAWNFEHSPNHGAFLREGFFTLPESARPIELHMGVRALALDAPGLAERARWYVSYCDSDTV